MIDLILPWPPSVNNIHTMGWRKDKAGKSYMGRIRGKRARTFEKEVWLEFKRKYRGAAPMEGEVSVSVFAHPPKGRDMDVDNLLKCTLDGLQAARVFENDSQVARLMVERCEPKGEGHLHVLVAERLFDPARVAVQDIANAVQEPA